MFTRGANVPFGELTLDAVRARADELRSAVGFGPTARVLPVAMAWRELGARMERAGAGTVKELPEDELDQLAGRLWMGSLLCSDKGHTRDGAGQAAGLVRAAPAGPGMRALGPRVPAEVAVVLAQ